MSTSTDSYKINSALLVKEYILQGEVIYVWGKILIFFKSFQSCRVNS